MVYLSSTGVVLVSLALLCDAVIGNVQEGAIKKYNEGATHVVLYSYSLGFIIILLGLIMTNQFFSAASFATQVNWESHYCPIFASLLCSGEPHSSLDTFRYIFPRNGDVGGQGILEMILPDKA